MHWVPCRRPERICVSNFVKKGEHICVPLCFNVGDVMCECLLRQMKTDEFDEVYKLLECSFPPDERRDYAGQRALLEESGYCIYVTDDDKVSGFLAVWQLGNRAFVEHFAVHPDTRGQGLGSKMLTALRKKLGCPLCLEAELPLTDIAVRRIAFYERNGFFVNEYPYEQPPFAADKKAVPLYVLTTDGKLSPERFEALRRQIYKTVYKREIN